MKVCRRCGEPFEIKKDGATVCFCSTECRDAQNKYNKMLRCRESYARNRKAKPHDCTCKRCGGIFQGSHGQQYCPDCLKSGGSYMNKLRGQRAREV